GGAFDQLCQPVHRCLGYSNPLHEASNTRRDVDWTTGAALAVRADLLRQLSGFDEGYARGYFEDVDLCLRAREAGYKVVHEPACTLIHHVGTSGGSPFFRQNARRFREQWVDTGKVKPGTVAPQWRWW